MFGLGKRHGKELLVVLIIAICPILLSVIRYYGFGIWYTDQEPDYRQFIGGSLYSLVTTAVLYTGASLIVHRLNTSFPWKENPVKRIIIELILVFGFAITAQIIILYGFSFMPDYFCEEYDTAYYFENIFFGNTITFIVVGLSEGRYFFEQWKASLLQTERLKSENAKSQFSSLKSQLDPHFLFNSLNVLSSLIRKDPARAEFFIDDFAKVYRYVLDVKNEMVVPLERELHFLDSYLNLQKIRFGEGLQVKREIDPESLHQFVPPLSLQELVNNAIKHNESSVENPLLIEVFNENGHLVIRNNLQPRGEKVNSTGVGVKNLKERYRLLSDKIARFRILDHQYVAQIPLIDADL